MTPGQCTGRLGVVVLTGAAALALAAWPAVAVDTSNLSRNVWIDEVVLDFETDELLIVGGGFNLSYFLFVTLGASDHVGEITDLCVPDFTTQPETILCAFGEGGLPADGEYTLRVGARTPLGAIVMSDEFDVTVAATQPVILAWKHQEGSAPSNSTAYFFPACKRSDQIAISGACGDHAGDSDIEMMYTGPDLDDPSRWKCYVDNNDFFNSRSIEVGVLCLDPN